MFSRPVQLTHGRRASSARAFSASRRAAVSAASSHGVSPWGKPTQKSKDSIIRIPVEAKLPARAQVLVAGSGLIGNSVAYHLVQNGWSDVVIIDRGNIADGTSKYGSGMLGLFRPTHERKIVQDCIELYRDLQRKGFEIELDQCGSLNLANSKDRLLSLERRANRYKPTGLDCQVLAPSEIQELHPYLYTEDIQGGVWVPEDATVHPKKVSEALAFLAYSGGARFVGDCAVQRVISHSSNKLGPSSSGNVKVKGVETSRGTIECEYFVNCAGIWARNLGLLSDPVVKVPICPAEHFFLTFKEIPELAGKKLPNVRDYDSHIYARTWRDSFLIGAFEREARHFKPGPSGQSGERYDSNEITWNDITEDHWRHMAAYISSATKRLPILKETEYDFLLNTPDAFTPDGRWILGEAPEIGNYFVAAGMNGNSLQGAGGVGKVVADWICEGHAPGNVLKFELQRFTSMHNTPRFLYERTFEVVGRHYQLQYPLVDEFRRGRKIRTSPLFSELEARGAVFGERMGWERPLYFDPFHSREDPPAQLPKGTFGKPDFFDNVEEEYLVCREGVGIIDMSSFAKFMIRGEPGAVVAYLQHLCSNDVDIPVGGVVPTGMHNKKGGYENDCLLIRKNAGDFVMVSPTPQQTRVLEWMLNHLPADRSVTVQDITSMYTVLTVCGPKAKDLMQEMTSQNMNMPQFTWQYVNMAYASGVMAVAVTQTGEAGYSLYIPSDHALHLYDRIMTVGKTYGIMNVGHLAMRFLRIEKFIPFWGEELTSETTPFEVGRTFKVKLDKAADFIGKEALLGQKESGVTRRLVQFQLKDFNKDRDYWPSGGEAVYRNGEFVGYVTNSAYGFSLLKMICLGFVQHPESITGTARTIDNAWLLDRSAEWEINIAGRMIKASMSPHAPKIPNLGPEDKQKPSKSGSKPKDTLFDDDDVD